LRLGRLRFGQLLLLVYTFKTYQCMLMTIRKLAVFLPLTPLRRQPAAAAGELPGQRAAHNA